MTGDRRAATPTDELGERSFLQVVDDASFGSLVLDSGGRIAHANAYGAEIFGYEASELQGLPFDSLLTVPWDEVCREEWGRRFGTDDGDRGPAVLEVVASRGDGSEVNLNLLFGPKFGSRQQYVMVIPHPIGSGRVLHSLFASALEASADGILVVDLEGRMQYWNGRFAEMWRLPAPVLDDANGREALRMALDQLEDPDAFLTSMKELYSAPEETRTDLLHFEDGRIFERSSLPQRVGNRVVGRVWTFRDVTEQREIPGERALLAAIVESSDDAIIGHSLEGRITNWNGGAENLFGYSREEAIGRSVSMLVPVARTDETRELLERVKAGERPEPVETIRLCRDGRQIHVSLNVSPVRNSAGRVVAASTIARDITERKRLEAELARMAYHDPLTDLLNRRSLEEQAENILALAARKKGRAGLVYVDLSYFKSINDALGHKAGDEVLVKVARRLHQRARESDLVARIGGDEFAVLLSEVESESGALAAAERLSEGLTRPVQVAGHSLHVQAQFGVALFPDHAEDLEGLLAGADQAMYRTKEDRDRQIQVYAPEAD